MNGKQQIESLKERVQKAVEEGNRDTAAECNREITVLLSPYPAWVQKKLDMASSLPDTPEIRRAQQEWRRLSTEVHRTYQQGAYMEGLDLAVQALNLSRLNFGEKHPHTWKSINDLAIMYQLQKDFDKAEPLLVENFQRRKEILGEKHPHTLISMNNLATLLEARHQYEEARVLYEQSLRLRREVLGELHPETLNATQHMGSFYLKVNKMEQAQSLLERCLSLRRQELGEFHPDTLSSIHASASLKLQQKLYVEAAQLFSQSWTLSRAIMGDNHPYTRSLLQSMADLISPLIKQSVEYQSEVELEKAEKAMAIALQFSREVSPDKSILLNLQYRLIQLLERQGKYHAARDHLTEALELSTKLHGERHQITLTLRNDWGLMHQNLGNYEKAKAIYQAVLPLRVEVLGDNHQQTLTTIHCLATVYQLQGAYDEAEIHYEKIFRHGLKGQGRDHPETLALMGNMATLYHSQGRNEKAEKWLQDILELRKKVSGPQNPNTLVAQFHLASFYRTVLQNKKATDLMEDTYTQSLAALGANHPVTLGAQLALAGLYLFQDDGARAKPLMKNLIQNYVTAFGAEHPYTLAAMNDHATFLLLEENFEEATRLQKKTWEQAQKALGDYHPHTLSLSSNLALLYELSGKLDMADGQWISSFRETNRFFNVLWGAAEPTRLAYVQQQEWNRHHFLTYFSKRDIPHAAKILLAFSLARKGLLLTIAAEVQHLTRRNPGHKLQKLAEKLKTSRHLLANMAFTVPPQTDHANFRSRFEALEDEIEKLETEISGISSGFRKNKDGISPEQVLSALRKDEVLVDFHIFRQTDIKNKRVLDGHLLALIVAKNQTPAYRIVDYGPMAPINRQIETFIDRLRQVHAPTKVAHELWQSLWKPLRPHLQGKQTIFLVPDGALNLLPWDSLVDEDDNFLGLSRERLVLLSSPRDLVSQPVSSQARGAMVVYNPNFDAGLDPDGKTTPYSIMGSFSPLPGTAQEGEAIIDLFDRAMLTPKKLEFGDATKKAILEIQSPRILHIATHGFFMESMPSHFSDGKRGQFLIPILDKFSLPAPPGKNPLLHSGLVFAGANRMSGDGGSEGILSALEALSLNLQGTELVVLSACETGLGAIRQGEGVYGLRRAFLEAGAKRVLSTLWKVDDEATAVFMKHFYNLYVHEYKTPREALLQTKQEFLNNEAWNHPYYWAPFVLVERTPRDP